MVITGNRFQLFDRLNKTSKTLFILTLLIFWIQSISIAQNSKTMDFLVWNSGDSLFGAVEHINLKGVSSRFYKKIRLTDTRRKPKRFNRKDVIAFQVNGEIYESFWIYQSSEKISLINPKYVIGAQIGEQYFLKLISKGKLSHYQMEWWEQGESSLMQMDLLRKENDHFFIRATQGIFGLKTKVLINYFTNCPELQKQIEKRQFKEVGPIVDFYNSNCFN